MTSHEVGRQALQLDWAALLTDLAETPVEAVQLHHMRVGRPRGALAADFLNAWAPQHEALLLTVLQENRRYQRLRTPRLIEEYALRQTPRGWDCDPELSRQAGGLTYAEMVELADRADFRQVLWQMGKAIATLFEQVVQRLPLLQNLPSGATPTWAELTTRWQRRHSPLREIHQKPLP